VYSRSTHVTAGRIADTIEALLKPVGPIASSDRDADLVIGSIELGDGRRFMHERAFQALRCRDA
jgi:hypothetical protein